MAQGQNTRWWLIRHAPVINPDRLVYGRSDMKVDLADVKSLRALARQLPKDAVWLTSHLSRSLDTALCLLEIRGEDITPIRDNALAEQHFGLWEKRRWQDLPQGETIRFWADFARQHPPQGESFADVVHRVGPVIDAMTHYWAGRDIVAIVHGGTVRAALARMLGLSLEAALAFHVDTLGLTRAEYLAGTTQPGWRVTGVNLRY
jgi:alpha-ribazole phosphatase